jgi:hypothetical protein
MRSGILLHPTQSHRRVAATPVALAMMGEVVTKALNALVIKQVAPISIEDPETTTKGTQVRMEAPLPTWRPRQLSQHQLGG